MARGRRRLARLTAIVICLAVMAGVAGLGAAADAATIEVWLPRGGQETDPQIWEELAKAFEDQNPEIKVNLRFVAESALAYAQKLLQSSRTGKLAEVDLVYLGGNYLGGCLDVGALAMAGMLAPLTDYLDPGKFIQPSLVPFRGQGRFAELDGALFKAPVALDYELVAYNKDLFAQYKLAAPRTWEEYLGLLAKLKKEGVIPAMAGGRDLVGLVFQKLQQWLYTLSGDLNLFGKIVFGFTESPQNPYFRQALALFQQEAQYFGPGWETAEPQRILPLFWQGQLALIGGNGGTIKRTEEEKPGFPLGIYPPPQIEGKPSQVRGFVWGFGMGAFSKNKSAAAKFLQFLTSEEVQLAFTEMNLSLPVVKAVYQSPRFKELGKNYPEFQTIVAYLEHVFVEPVFPISIKGVELQFVQQVGDAMVAVGAGRLTVDQAVAELTALQEKLKKL